jgi:SAM-dependent methyltransferase
MNPRTAKVLARIDPSSQRGLEIGALDRPLITPDIGDIRYVDYATTEQLQAAHATTPTVNTTGIVPVHYVWGDMSLRDAVGPGTTFDYVVASHVLEHVPDLVGWFRELADVLRPAGVVSLIIPDKRYIFDRLRQPSQLSEIIEAWLEGHRKPSIAQIFDFLSLHSRVDAGALWRGCADTAVERVHDEAFALARCRDAAASGRYVDAHCWVFTPQIFFGHIRRLSELDLFDFTVAEFFPTARGEIDFFVSFERLDPALSREERLRRQRTGFPERFDDAVPGLPPDGASPTFSTRRARGLLGRVRSGLKARLSSGR